MTPTPYELQQVRVRGLVHRAVKNGTLVRQPCEVCGRDGSDGTRIEAHHEDYSKPLDVRWLCRLHHSWRHKYGDSVDSMIADERRVVAELAT